MKRHASQDEIQTERKAAKMAVLIFRRAKCFVLSGDSACFCSSSTLR